MKGSPRAVSADAAGPALTPARLASRMAASQPPLSIIASAVASPPTTPAISKPAVDQQLFEGECEHRLVLDNEDARDAGHRATAVCGLI